MKRSRTCVPGHKKRDWPHIPVPFLYSTIGQLSSNQRHLATRRTEGCAIKVEAISLIEPQAFDRFAEALCQQVGKRPFATHSGTKSTVVEFAATALANQAQHMGCPLRVMCGQPFFKQR